jgi:hypothetical protein
MAFSHIDKNGRTNWLCQCDCGAEETIRGKSLRSGNTKSCGCLHRDATIQRNHAGRLDLLQQRFGRLIVVAFSHLDSRGFGNWHVRCDCGNEKIVCGTDLRKRTTKSCGCWRREIKTTHGHTIGGFSPEYESWRAMLDRCENPNATGYKYYGGRGIVVCEEWHSFENFLRDMGLRPPGTSIDRIHPDGDYEKQNCRWATASEQRRNQRS